MSERRIRVQKCCEGESLTQQHEADAVDMNLIMKRFTRTGEIPVRAERPIYGDSNNVMEYERACQIVCAVESGFASLPSEVRARFKNSPLAMVEAVELAADPEQGDLRDELVELGVIDYLEEVSGEVLEEEESQAKPVPVEDASSVESEDDS